MEMIKRWAHRVLFLVLLVFFVYEVVTDIGLRNGLVAFNKSIYERIFGTPDWATDMSGTTAAGAIVWLMIFIEAFIAISFICAIIGAVIGNAGRIGSSMMAHVVMLAVIVISIAMAMYEASILFGDVTILGHTIWPGYAPDMIAPMTIAWIGFIGGWYAFAQFIPIMTNPLMGGGMAAINMISSAIPTGVYFVALFRAFLGIGYDVTPLRWYALMIWSFVAAFDIAAALIIVKFQRRGYFAATEEIPLGHRH